MPSSEKFRDNVVAQFNGMLLEGAFRVTDEQIADSKFLTRLLVAMLPQVPAPKAKKK